MGATLHGGMEIVGGSKIKRAVVVMGLLACSILQQCTVAAALMQADDAAVLLQFQLQYNFTAEGWAGDSPCGVSPGELCVHVIDACAPPPLPQQRHSSHALHLALQAGRGAM